MNPNPSNKTTLVTVLVILLIAGGGFYAYTLWVDKKVEIVQTVVPDETTVTKEQIVEAPVEMKTELLELNGKPLSVYTNTDLKFSFMYPTELGTPKSGFDTNNERTGEQFNGGFLSTKGAAYHLELGYSIYFGASSAEYHPNLGRGAGLSDMTRSMSKASDDYQVVSSIKGNGVDGILIEGTEKCIDMCPYANTYHAIFPIKENKWGINVIGISGYKILKEDFVKLMSTFTVLE